MTSAARDAGFTLIELVIATALGLLVLTIVGGLFVNTMTSQQEVQVVGRAADTAQVAADRIGTDVRNSSGIQLTTPSGTTDQLLIARVAGGGTPLTWRCEAWYYRSANGGSLSTTTVSDGTVLSAPTIAQLASWTPLLTGVTPRSGTGIFTLNGSTLATSFNATAAGNSPVAIQFSSVPLTGVTGASSCF